MSGRGSYVPKSRLGRIVNNFEESAIALLLGLMVTLTFVNVVARYVFNSTVIWGLEATLVLFAWLVLFGVSYAVKVGAHLGVDALLNVVSSPVRRLLALASALAFLIYTLLLLKGAWDFWAPFANLPPTTGRWFPTGFEDMKPWDYRGYVPVETIPLPELLRPFLEWLLLFEGDEPFEKLPIVIPYLIVPVGVLLLLFRVVQATVRLMRGEIDSMIASHEAEDAVEELSANRSGEG
jgi:C4-dicarboxylate transporter DctQ subunit